MQFTKLTIFHTFLSNKMKKQLFHKSKYLTSFIVVFNHVTTVKLSFATIPYKQPSLVRDHLFKIPKVSESNHYNRTSCNPLPLISDHLLQVTTFRDACFQNLSQAETENCFIWCQKSGASRIVSRNSLPLKFLLVSHFSKNFDSTIWSNQVSLMWIVPNTVLNNLWDNLLIKNHCHILFWYILQIE